MLISKIMFMGYSACKNPRDKSNEIWMKWLKPASHAVVWPSMDYREDLKLKKSIDEFMSQNFLI